MFLAAGGTVTNKSGGLIKGGNRDVDIAQQVACLIELETHDGLIADGATAESYRDDGNRWLFRNRPSPPAYARARAVVR